MSKKHPDDGGRSGRSEIRSRARRLRHRLGHEPPLSVSGADAADIDRRDVNTRWLGASVLTGITGGALIGASIYVALEGATIVGAAARAGRPTAGRGRAAASGRARRCRKGDGSTGRR